MLLAGGSTGQYAPGRCRSVSVVRIDLHTHSVCSDGTQTPAELVASARRAGLDVVALTDHDTYAGWDEAGEAATREGMTLVPGVEVSCAHHGISVHLLGYLPGPGHPGLLEEMDRSREHRLGRMQAMVERLARDGYEISYQDVLDQAPDGATLGRPHLADALVAAGRFPDRQAAFESVIHDRSPYYVAHYSPPPVLAVELVLAAGGVPVMAHPFAHARGRTVGEEVIVEMAEAGLQGLEVHHRDHDAEATARAAALAERLGLFATGSSDYHGAGKPNRLGEHTTEPGVLATILDRATGTSVRGLPARW